jgi:cobyrinic acid a,c-diamide synthase
MALGEALIAKDGTPHEMAGLLPLTTSFTHPVLHLGYRRMTLAHSCSLGPVGTVFRGHEFHYASIVSEGPSPALFSCENASGERLGFSGLARGNVCGSFLHMIDRDTDGEDTVTDSACTETPA